MDSPVIGLDGVRVPDVLRLIVQPALRLHRILVGNLGRSILVPGRKEGGLVSHVDMNQSLLVRQLDTNHLINTKQTYHEPAGTG